MKKVLFIILKTVGILWMAFFCILNVIELIFINDNAFFETYGRTFNWLLPIGWIGLSLFFFINLVIRYKKKSDFENPATDESKKDNMTDSK